jgi:hypothetical protein
MFSSKKMRVGVVGLVLAGASCLTGCSGEPGATAEEPSQGSLSLPVTAQAGDHVYRLDGQLNVSGPEYRWIYLSAYEDVATVALTTGAYSASLYYWTLYRETADGQLQAVQSDLIDGPYRSFNILNGTTSTIAFNFETEGELVTVGSGNLNIDVGVTERPPVCTPLGEGCTEGNWCAPSSLLGTPVSCVVAGTVELGQECSSPLDCVANASCFDLGDGAKCAQLCLSEDFDQPCSTGGTCRDRGQGYGVCEPDAVTP